MNRPIERENFLKILVAVQEFGTNTHRELIKLALKRKNLTFCELLDRNAHELYHLCFNSLCCQCGRIDRLPDVKSIHRDQYFKLFPEDQSKRLHGHITGKIYYKCCNYASTSVSPDNLDFGLAFTILLHCCKEFLWDCCLSAKQKTLPDFLNENKHDIFHMQNNNMSCSLCNNGIKPTVKGSIGKADWDLLFKTSTGYDDPNNYSAIQGITSGNLNSNLSYQLLLAFSDEIKSSKQLREFRNQIAHHVSLTIKVDEFEQKWSEIETILIQLSNTYKGDIDMKEKLQQLKSEKDCKEKIEPLLEDLKKEQELEDTLKVIYIDISYIRDHFCTKEDLENSLREFFQQIQHVYEPRSSNEIRSKEMKIKGQAKGSSFRLDKSREEYQREKISDNTIFVKRIFGTAFTENCKNERHEERYILKLRADAGTDQTASTSVFDSTSFKGNPAEEDIIPIENQAEEDNSESDTDDELRCGQCKEIYKSIKKFKKHKRSHKPKRRKEIFIKLTVDGIPDDQTIEIIELRALNGTTVDNVEIVDAAIGSLVIWTRMSTTVLQTKDKFLTTIEKVMKELFNKSPADINQTVDVTIGITIADEFQDDYEDDEGDMFTCGVCLKEFFVLEAFERHKKKQCKKQSNTSPQCSTSHTSIAGHYHVIEYNLDAFPRVHRIQQKLSTCVNMAEIQGEILKVMYQYPRLVFYNANDESSIDSFYLKNHRSTKKTVSQAEIKTGIANGIPTVFVCVLKAEYGHLTNIDRQCLHKIKKELPDHWIDKTLFVVSATSFSGSFRHFHTLSHELGIELGIEMSDIAYRIFKDKDIGILRRVSLHFERQLVEKREVLCRNLEILKLKFHEAIQHTQSLPFELALHLMLSAGPFGNNLFTTLKNSTRSYVWHGESFTRNKFTVTDATDKITRYTCKELGKVIVRTILEHFKNEVRSGNHDLFSVIYQHIDLKYFEISILRGIVVVLAYFLLGRLGWLVSAVVILFAGTDINSDSFRIEIANTMFTQITQNANQIISEVIKTVRSDAMSRYNQFKSSLSSSETEIRRFFRKEKKIFRKDNIENEFRTIAGIHELIRNFKFEDDTLKIYASGNEENYEDVKEFVDAYFRSDVNTEVFMDQNTEGI